MLRRTLQFASALLALQARATGNPTCIGRTRAQAKAYVSQNTSSAVSEILNSATFGVNNLQGGACGHLISKLQLLSNDKDWDSAVTDLRILAVSEAKGGTVSLTASGDVLFTPDATYTGVMGFKYQVADAQNNMTQVSVGTGATAQTAPMKAAVFLASADLQDSQGRIDPLLVQQWYLAEKIWQNFNETEPRNIPPSAYRFSGISSNTYFRIAA